MIKTRLRGSGWRLGVWYFGAFSLSLGVYGPIDQNDLGPRLPFKKFTSHRRILSRDISPTNYEPRLLPIYISVGDVPTFMSRRCRVIY